MRPPDIGRAQHSIVVASKRAGLFRQQSFTDNLAPCIITVGFIERVRFCHRNKLSKAVDIQAADKDKRAATPMVEQRLHGGNIYGAVGKGASRMDDAGDAISSTR